MTNLNLCTRNLNVVVSYLGDYLGFDQSIDIQKSIHDLRCFWGVTIYDNDQQLSIDYKHNRTTFYINYTINIEELTDDEISRLMRVHNCILTGDTIEGSLLIDSDEYEVDFEPMFEDGVLAPAGVEIFVDQKYIHII